MVILRKSFAAALALPLALGVLAPVAHAEFVAQESGSDKNTTFYRTLIGSAYFDGADGSNPYGAFVDGTTYTSNVAPLAYTVNSTVTTSGGATMHTDAYVVPNGFYSSRNYVDMTLTNAQNDESYYAVAGYGSRTQIQFYAPPDAVRTTYTWRVSGTESVPIGEGGSRLDFAAVAHDSLYENAGWYDLFATPYPSPLGSSPMFGADTYTFNIPGLTNTPIDLFFWSSAYIQVNIGDAPQGSNQHLFANYGSTYELVGIDLYDAFDNLITDWSMEDLSTGTMYTSENFMYTPPEPPSSVPAPGGLALYALGLLGVAAARRRKMLA